MGNMISRTIDYVSSFFIKTIDADVIREIPEESEESKKPKYLVIEDEREACKFINEKIRNEKYLPSRTENKVINIAIKKERLPKDKEDFFYLLEMVNTLYEKSENKEHNHKLLESYIIKLSEDLRLMYPVYYEFKNLCVTYVFKHKYDPIQVKWNSIFDDISDSLIRFISDLEEHYFGENCHEKYNLDNNIETHNNFIKSLIPKDKFNAKYWELRELYSSPKDFCPNQIFNKILNGGQG